MGSRPDLSPPTAAVQPKVELKNCLGQNIMVYICFVFIDRPCFYSRDVPFSISADTAGVCRPVEHRGGAAAAVGSVHSCPAKLRRGFAVPLPAV